MNDHIKAQKSEGREASELPDWLCVGAACLYRYPVPHGFNMRTEYFPATILGFTRRRVKIEAFDGQVYYTAYARRESLFPRDA